MNDVYQRMRQALAAYEIDGDVGTVEVLRYVVVHDCGNMINPMIVDGQITGGVVCGIGNALLRRIVRGAQGEMLTPSLPQYALPKSMHAPNIEIHHLCTPAPSIPGGFRGAGEGGAIASPARTLTQINDALAQEGQVVNTAPTSPDLLWKASRK